MATGVLVLAVGPATRFLQYLSLEPKVYEAVFEFGESTDTYDSEGVATFSGPVPADLNEAFNAAVPTYLGLIEQIPPMYSAVKVDGKPLYKYARQGITLERTARRIHIAAIDGIHTAGNSVSFRVECSGGTYIRTLGHDIGMRLGCGAKMTDLRRSRVGRFGLIDSVPLADIDTARMVPLRSALEPMASLEMDEAQVHNIREGRTVILLDPPEAKLAALIEPGGNVFSVARVIGNIVQPECVIPAGVNLGVV